MMIQEFNKLSKGLVTIYGAGCTKQLYGNIFTGMKIPIVIEKEGCPKNKFTISCNDYKKLRELVHIECNCSFDRSTMPFIVAQLNRLTDIEINDLEVCIMLREDWLSKYSSINYLVLVEDPQVICNFEKGNERYITDAIYHEFLFKRQLDIQMLMDLNNKCKTFRNECHEYGRIYFSNALDPQDCNSILPMFVLSLLFLIFAVSGGGAPPIWRIISLIIFAAMFLSICWYHGDLSSGAIMAEGDFDCDLGTLKMAGLFQRGKMEGPWSIRIDSITLMANYVEGQFTNFM